MNLGEIRAQFETLSGRSDLVNADGSDNGADFHINAGVRRLDRLTQIDKATARLFRNITSGDHVITFQDCRVIEKVWVADGTSRISLIPVNMDALRGEPDDKNLWHAQAFHRYGNELQQPTVGFPQPFSSIETAKPVYYAIAQLRITPDPEGLIIGLGGGITGYMDVMFTSSDTYNGILFLPPSDGDYTIEVRGKFYSPTLSVDADSNVWSSLHPDVLLMASLRSVEVFNRNTTGVIDWNNAIGDELLGVEKDIVEQELADKKMRMEG